MTKSSGVEQFAATAGLLLDLALLTAASTYLLLPEWRGTSSKALVLGLYFAQSGLGIYRLWRTGHLSKSLPELHTSIKAWGPPRRRTFEGPANFIGLIAVGFVFWA